MMCNSLSLDTWPFVSIGTFALAAAVEYVLLLRWLNSAAHPLRRESRLACT
jgi:hypothetical protein